MATNDPIPDYIVYDESTEYMVDTIARVESSELLPSPDIKRRSSLSSTGSSETGVICRIIQNLEANDNRSLCSLNHSASHVSVGSSVKTTIGGTHITNINLNAKHLKGATESILEHHRNRNTFAKTKLLDEALMKLVGRKKVIILSNFGEGRTSLGLELLLQLNKEDAELYTQKEPLIIRTASEWRVAINPEGDSAVLLDDIFGRLTFNKKRYSQWESIFTDIQACVDDSSVYLIITMNKYIFQKIRDRLRRQDLFSNMEGLIVDLSVYDKEDKELILTKQFDNPKSRHRRYKIVPDETRATDRESVIHIYEREVEEILSISNHVAFPLCCSSYVNDYRCQLQGPEFFRNPTEIIYPEIETLCESDRYACLLLSLILFAKTGFTLCDIFYTDNYVAITEHIAKLCSVQNAPFELLCGKLEKKMKQLRNIFVIDCQGELSFMSSTVQVSMVKVFGTISTKYLIENLKVELLVKYTTTSETNDKKVCIDDFHLDRLAKRFAREIGRLSNISEIKKTIQIIAECEIMSNESFRERFVGHLTRMANYRTLIQCREPEETENLLSTLFLHQHGICRQLAEEILKQTPDTIKVGCCCVQRSNWFTLEIHRSILLAVEIKDYKACLILGTLGGDLPKKLLRKIIENGDWRIYSYFPQINETLISRYQRVQLSRNEILSSDNWILR